MTFKLQMQGIGASSTVQGLRLPASTAGTMDLTLIRELKSQIPHACIMWPKFFFFLGIG